ncbi:TPA: SH3 domain-containing protein [Enterococcus faecium]|nr:SH3 domain-containing protein [Enterococcus faecium]
MVIPPAIFFYYSTLSDSRFKTLQQNLRDYPSTNNSNVLAQYTNGDNLIYDSYVVNNGYVWLSYIASSGARRYVAWRVQNGETYGEIV